MKRLRIVAALALVAIAGGLATKAIVESQRFARANDVCVTVASDAAAAAALALPLPAGTEAHRMASECLCLSDFVAGQGERCLDRLLPYMDDLDAGWRPDVDVAVELADLLLQQDRWPLARKLLDVTVADHPWAVTVNELWLDAHAIDGDEAALIGEVLARAQTAPNVDEKVKLTLLVAVRRAARSDREGCIEAVGDVARFNDLAGQQALLVRKTECLAALERRDDVVAEWEAWVGRGGDRLVADTFRCHVLLTGHAAQQSDLERLLEIDRAPGNLPLPLRQMVARRLIGDLVMTRRADAADVLARARRDLGFEGDSVDDFERATAANDSTAGAGTIEVRLRTPLTGAKLLVSPSSSVADEPFVVVPFDDGVASVVRVPGRVPVRWVLLADDGPRASGAAWVRAAATTSALVDVGAAPAMRTYARPTPRPGDGRTRVYVLIPDSWDWRLLNTLRARGEMPVIDSLIAAGASGVLWSEPAMTATAMTSLAWPEAQAPFGVVQLVHEMGEELGGLASIGSNPLAFLSPWMRPRPSLFATIGTGDRVVANMLFSHADIDAGRNAERTGPAGRQRRIAIQQARRPLRTSEGEAARVVASGASVGHVDTISAQLDLFGELIDAKEDDLVLLRAEAVDLLTHGHFGETATGRQDDATSILYATYRLIDLRLAEIVARLDADDVIVIMSDHGALTSLQHDNPAVFIAAGGGVPHLRLEGTPNLRGVPRYLADLLGVPTTFPETGLAAALPSATSSTSTSTSTP